MLTLRIIYGVSGEEMPFKCQICFPIASASVSGSPRFCGAGAAQKLAWRMPIRRIYVYMHRLNLRFQFRYGFLIVPLTKAKCLWLLGQAAKSFKESTRMCCLRKSKHTLTLTPVLPSHTYIYVCVYILQIYTYAKLSMWKAIIGGLVWIFFWAYQCNLWYCRLAPAVRNEKLKVLKPLMVHFIRACAF